MSLGRRKSHLGLFEKDVYKGKGEALTLCIKATHGHGITRSQSYSPNGSRSQLAGFTNQNKIFHVVQPATSAWCTERSAGDLSPLAVHPHPHTEESRDTTELATALLIQEAEQAHSLICRSRVGCTVLTVMKICICQFIKLI